MAHGAKVGLLAIALAVEAAGATGRAFIRAVLAYRRNSPPHYLHRSRLEAFVAGHASISLPSTETCSPTTVA